MTHLPPDLADRLRAHNQEHVLAGWDQLGPEQRAHLAGQLQALDFDLLRRLYTQRDVAYSVPAEHRITPLPGVLPDAADPEARRLGEAALAAGEVAVIVVAGGQGSRLGFEHPKGLFPVGPVSGKSLFQVHAEKVLALRRRYGQRVPLLIMTSDATHDETTAYFAAQGSGMSA